MKKNYILLSGLVLASCLSFAQNGISGKFASSEVDAKLSAESRELDPDILKKNTTNQKIFGDTIGRTAGTGGIYFDFNGSSQGWSVVNNSANNFQWQWATTYQNGQFSTGTTAINSSTGTNGFMSLTGDFFNTPIPPGGAVAMDTYFESPSLDLTAGGANPGGLGSVWVTYQQSLRYCCSGANRLVLQVSADNFVTFEEYDASDAIAVNAASGTVNNVINISSAARNQTSITMRFYSEGNSHYYWMIDDVAVIEGPSFDMALFVAFPEFNGDSFGINPFYSQIPLDLFQPLAFSGFAFNNGGANATNARLEVAVTNDSVRTPGSTTFTPGLGLQYWISEPTTATSLAPDSFEFLVAGANSRFVPTTIGQFTMDFTATSDDVDENPVNETDFYTFEITDTVMATHDGGLGGGLAPSGFVRNGVPGGTAVGDRLATMFIVEPNANAASQLPRVSSISYLVSTDSANVGVEIIPKVFEFDENQATIDAAVVGEVASSFLPYVVQAADLGTWITLPLDNGTGFFTGLTPGQYMAGWETTSITGGTDFEVQEDQSSGSRQPGVTTIIDFGHSPGWGSVAPTNPGIQLNFNIPLVTSVNNVANTTAEFSVSPNPNNGEFKISVATNSNISYNLVVRNMLGQSVHTESISVNGQMTKQLDLRAFEKGVYFVSLENETEKVVKKVIIK